MGISWAEKNLTMNFHLCLLFSLETLLGKMEETRGDKSNKFQFERNTQQQQQQQHYSSRKESCSALLALSQTSFFPWRSTVLCTATFSSLTDLLIYPVLVVWLLINLSMVTWTVWDRWNNLHGGGGGERGQAGEWGGCKGGGGERGERGRGGSKARFRLMVVGREDHFRKLCLLLSLSSLCLSGRV